MHTYYLHSSHTYLLSMWCALLLRVVCYLFHPQCVVHCFGDAIEFILAMHNDRAAPDHSLCPDPHGGLSCRNVAKLDVAKLKTPKEWG